MYLFIILVTQLFKLMEKYRPETAAMKKRRLQVRYIQHIMLLKILLFL